jgi:hypothetical protein
MLARIEKEAELLRRRFASVTIGPEGKWIRVDNVPLPPERYNHAKTTVVVLLPVGYPNTGPDNFFVSGGLKFKDGRDGIPAYNEGSQSGSGPSPLEGSWGWFSWHPQKWSPAADPEKGDNLEVFMRGVAMCLRGEEVT